MVINRPVLNEKLDLKPIGAEIVHIIDPDTSSTDSRPKRITYRVVDHALVQAASNPYALEWAEEIEEVCREYLSPPTSLDWLEER